MEGKALKYGDNINTDLIFPGIYMTLTNPEDLARYAMSGIDPHFPEKVKSYGILVAGRNFGCGSSREHAPVSLKYAGTRCIIAKSFARIFYRNAVNIGLPIIECKEVAEKVYEGDRLLVDLERGLIENLSSGLTFKSRPLPKFILSIFRHGGLIGYVNAGSENYR
ncbi:MAG: 3-isopropylmalate dehydratase small subunit [Candidatus Bathyarchaeia archaeon]